MLPANIKKIHFIGIGGYGMSALAMILLQMGYDVSGSDLKTSRLTERLLAKGATIHFSHQTSNISDCQLVVYSTAIPDENPELQETRRRDLPLWHRSEMLASLVNNHYGIAVAGTHGKTTTTSMLALLLERGGLDPTAVIGGEVSVFDGNARLGKSDYLVAEACESDNSFLRYNPRMAIVTNIEADHLEFYDGDFEKLKQAYDQFITNIDNDGCAILCGEDPLLMKSAAVFPGKVITYGVEDDKSAEGAEEETGAKNQKSQKNQRNQRNHQKYDYTAANISYEKTGSLFTVYFRGAHLTDVKLGVPGRHNISNALAAIAAAAELNINLQVAIKALNEFTGAGRRFEILGETGGITVVDDYAHHPTEIKATLEAARKTGAQRVLCIFQPHRYTRTSFFLNDYAGAFPDADMVFLHRIYSAGEKALPGVSSEILAGMIEEKTATPVYYGETLQNLAEMAINTLRPGDMIITMGAGDVWKAGHMILDGLPNQQRSAAR